MTKNSTDKKTSWLKGIMGLFRRGATDQEISTPQQAPSLKTPEVVLPFTPSPSIRSQQLSSLNKQVPIGLFWEGVDSADYKNESYAFARLTLPEHINTWGPKLHCATLGDLLEHSMTEISTVSVLSEGATMRLLGDIESILQKKFSPSALRPVKTPQKHPIPDTEPDLESESSLEPIVPNTTPPQPQPATPATDETREPQRMPPLTIDEVLLLVDTYFTLNNVITPVVDPNERKELISDLSANMRRLPFYPNLRNDPRFRSVKGMELCLRNVNASSRPENTLTFAQPSRLTKYIYNYYSDNPKRLHDIVEKILAITDFDFPLLPEYADSVEGQILPSYNKHLQEKKTVKEIQPNPPAQKSSGTSLQREDVLGISEKGRTEKPDDIAEENLEDEFFQWLEATKHPAEKTAMFKDIKDSLSEELYERRFLLAPLFCVTSPYDISAVVGQVNSIYSTMYNRNNAKRLLNAYIRFLSERLRSARPQVQKPMRPVPPPPIVNPQSKESLIDDAIERIEKKLIDAGFTGLERAEMKEYGISFLNAQRRKGFSGTWSSVLDDFDLRLTEFVSSSRVVQEKGHFVHKSVWDAEVSSKQSTASEADNAEPAPSAKIQTATSNDEPATPAFGDVDESMYIDAAVESALEFAQMQLEKAGKAGLTRAEFKEYGMTELERLLPPDTPEKIRKQVAPTFNLAVTLYTTSSHVLIRNGRFYYVSAKVRPPSAPRPTQPAPRPAPEPAPSPMPCPGPIQPQPESSLEAFYTVLRDQFARGYRLGSAIDRKKFRIKYESCPGAREGLTDEVIERAIRSLTFEHNGKAYLPDAVLDARIKEELFAFIESGFAQGKKAIAYDALYAQFRDRFLDQKITDEDMLHAYLARESRGRWFAGPKYITKERRTTVDPYAELQACLKENYLPMTYDAICRKLLHLSPDTILQLLHTDRHFIVNSKARDGQSAYFHIDTFDVTTDESTQLCALMNTALEEFGFMTGADLYETVQKRLPRLFERNEIFSPLGWRNAIDAKLGSRFTFRGNIISKRGDSLSMSQLFANYARKNAQFSLDQLSQFADDIGGRANSPIYFDAIFAHAVRVSQEQFAAKRDVWFNVRETDAALERFCSGDYVALRSVDRYSLLPEASHPWNEFLLEQYAAFYSQKFGLLHKSYGKSGVTGALVKNRVRAGNFAEYDDLIVDVLVHASVELTKEKALDYLQRLGYIDRKAYANIGTILNSARARRNRKG